jgi:hypothetical protein
MPYLRNERGGASYSILLSMVLTLGLGAAITVSGSMSYGVAGGLDRSNPLSGKLRDRVNQSRALADMTAIGKANTAHLLRTGRYAASIAELEKRLRGLSLTDPWGTEWVYRTDGKHYLLASLGSDGAGGPKPPEEWSNDVFQPDLTLRDGSFVQAPQDQPLGSAVGKLEQHAAAAGTRHPIH